MHHNFQTLKKASYVSWVAMAVLLLLAFVFYKERALFLDSSYVLFRVVNDGRLAIQENRYGSFITQIVPLLGAKFHLPLKVIVIAYTVSFNVFYLAIISILIFRIRQYGLAILMSFFYLLYVTDTYYWTNNEVHQGIAWMFLSLGILQYGAIKKWNTGVLMLVFAVLGFLAISSHMLVMMPFVFLWFYIVFDREISLFNLKQGIVLSCLLWFMVWLKYHYSISQSYDGEKLKVTTTFNLRYTWEVATGTFGTDFLKQCIRVYWIVPVLFGIGMFSLLKDKRWWLALMTISACVLYYVFMCLTFSNTYYMYRFHIESEWMGLGIIASTPFVLHFLPRQRVSKAVLIVACIIIIRILYIINSGAIFTNHLQFTQSVLTKMNEKGIRKLAIHESRFVKSKLTLDWALPEESLLLSAMETKLPQRTVLIFHRGMEDTTMKNPVMFIGCFHNYKPQEINRNYFSIDTTAPYTLTTFTELMK